jgi:hypothetical protein
MSGETVKQGSGKQKESLKEEFLVDSKLTVLYEMVRLTLEGERIWFTKLCENLEGKKTSEGKITNQLLGSCLRILSDNKLIQRYTGETKKGYAGFLYKVSDWHIEYTTSMYKGYLEAIGAPKPKISEFTAREADKRRGEFSDSRFLIDSLKHRHRKTAE